MKARLTAIAIVALFASPLVAEDGEPTPIKATGITPKKTLEVTEITPDEAEKLIAAGNITILDIRTPEEFDHEHIKGAVNINLFDKEFKKAVAKLDQRKPVIIHCASGRRSRQSLTDLAGRVTFPKAYHLTDGISGWKKAGKPIESKPLPSEIKPAK